MCSWCSADGTWEIIEHENGSYIAQASETHEGISNVDHHDVAGSHLQKQNAVAA